MLIGFTGAQSTGKTTLLKLCKELLCDEKWTKCSDGVYRDEWNFVDEVTRKVMRDGFPINEDGDNLTQLFILKEHLKNHTVCGDEKWILDRCILDGYVYTKWLHSQNLVDKWVLDYSRNLLTMLGKYIDVIFYTEPDDIPIEDDGERSVNLNFRNDIINIYNDLLSHSMSTPGRDTWRSKVIRLSGTVDDRMQTIKKTILK